MLAVIGMVIMGFFALVYNVGTLLCLVKPRLYHLTTAGLVLRSIVGGVPLALFIHWFPTVFLAG